MSYQLHKQMGKTALLCGSLALTALTTKLQAQSKGIKAFEKIFQSQMQGVYDNKKLVDQVEEMPAQESRIFRIFAKDKETFWFMALWTSPAMPETPLLGRIIALRPAEGGRMTGEVYKMPEADKMNAFWLNPEKIKPDFSASDLERDACQSFVRKADSGDFWIWESSEDCVSDNPMGGFSKFKIYVEFSKDAFGSGTSFYDEAGNKLFSQDPKTDKFQLFSRDNFGQSSFGD